MTDPILSIGQSGLETTDEKIKSLVNRMANAETPGFRSSDVVVRSFPLELEAAQNKIQSEAPHTEGTFYNHAKGAMIRTGGKTDFALGSDGFFVVSCPWGEGYTRDGRFTIDQEGKIVSTVNKFPLLGQNGPITVAPGSDIELNQAGELMVSGSVVDRIRVVNFQSLQQLESVNGSIFKNTNQKQTPLEVDSPRMIQGYVEASNANGVDQMMDLVLLNRIYDMDTKIVTIWDQNATKAMEMGKVQ